MMKRKGDDAQSIPKQSENYRQQIEKIKKETESLREQLCLDSLQSTNAATGSQIARLQDQGDAYAKKIQQEQKKLEELDLQIAQVQQKIKEQRAAMGGAKGSRETNESIGKKIKGLENKLDKALQKYNEAIAHNKQLREQIDALRRERVVYDNIYTKLETELQEKKEEMQRITERGKKALEDREEAKRKMEELRRESEKEQEEFENEWRELGRLIEQDKKMKDFIKQRERPSFQEDPSAAELSEEQQLRKQAAKGAWSIVFDKASIQQSMDKVQAYAEAFEKIQKATGISDPDEIVKTFVEAEKHNYSLFNYVNELNNEMEKLEQQIKDIRGEIEQCRGQGVRTDDQRKQIVSDLERRLEKTDLRVQQYEHNYEKTMQTINALKAGIQSIFERIGCNTEAAQEMLGYQGVTETNMMQYLGIIEQRTNEILQMYSSVHTAPVHEHHHQAGAVSQAPKDIKIEAPPIPDPKDGDEEIDGTLPLQREEFEKNALKNMKKQFEKLAARKK